MIQWIHCVQNITPFCPHYLVAAQLLIVIRANYPCNRVTPFFAYWPAESQVTKKEWHVASSGNLIGYPGGSIPPPSSIPPPPHLQPPWLLPYLPPPNLAEPKVRGLTSTNSVNVLLGIMVSRANPSTSWFIDRCIFAFGKISSYISYWFSTSQRTVSKLTGCCPQSAPGAESFTSTSTVLFCCLLLGDGV